MTRLLALYRDAFRGLSREVWLLSLFMFVNRAGTMVLVFLVLYLTERHGYSATQAGTVLMLYGIGSICGIAASGWLVDRIGFRAVQVGALALGGCGLIIFGTLDPGWPMAVGAVLLGLVGESFRPANSTAISVFSRPENRARAFGLNRLAINLGVSIGPAIGGFLAEVDYSWLFWVDGATCIVAAGLMLVFVPAKPRAEGDEAQAPAGTSPWRDRAFVSMFALLASSGLIFFQVMSTYPLHLDQVFGFSKSVIGQVLAVNALIIVLFEMPLVKALEGREPLRLIGVAGLLLGAGFGLLPLVTSLAGVVALVVVWTVGEMLMAPMSITWVANRANDSNRGAYMAAFGICFSLCSALAPLLGTAVFEHLGPRVLWFGCGALGWVVFVGFRALAAREAA